MKPFTAIIVDDEQEARDILANLLKDYVPDIRVVAQAASADEAIDFILQEDPDIVFLDIDMPGKNGFEVAHSISAQQLQTTIVFVTAYNQFAIDAIKCSAFDYLLKPVSLGDLKTCITRYRASNKVQNLQQSVNQLMNCLNREKLSFHSRTGTIFIDPQTIVYCEAEGNYTDLFLEEGKRQTVSQSLGSVETMLDGNGFSRISRSVIINRRFLNQISRKEKKCKLIAAEKEYSLEIKSSYMRKWMK
jgi:two-component system LytT family response regulator